jgi:hypothetical protein
MTHRLDSTYTNAGTLLRLDAAWRCELRGDAGPTPQRCQPVPALTPDEIAALDAQREAGRVRAEAAALAEIRRLYGSRSGKRDNS